MSEVQEGKSMSHKRKDGIFVIQAEPARTCQMCGKKAECRPYGPNGQVVCFGCAMKDPEEAKRQLEKRMGVPQP